MAVDKNLFLHDLAVVAILWNEGHYLKEWLDYHLLAGVDHFYLYDHESTDNYNEIIKPYVDAGIVTSVYYPGKRVMYEVYNDAVHKYRYFCRYMAILDGDEFVFPQNNKSITETLDEILLPLPQAGGLVMNWQFYSSNGQEKADYTRGVLERFTSRTPKDSQGNEAVKNIVNPRCIDYIDDPHVMKYVLGRFRINEQGKIVTTWENKPVMHDKIILNHYHLKSREEFYYRKSNGDAVYEKVGYEIQKHFDDTLKNADKEVFDDGILKYRENRISTLIPQGGGYDVLESLAASKQIDYQKLCVALVKNLAPVFSEKTAPQNFAGQMETFLTCRALASYLRKEVLGDTAGKIFEEAALRAILRTLQTNFSITDIKFLFSELPEILALNYPVVEETRKSCINLVPQLMNIYRMNNLWRDFNETYYFGEMLKTFDNYIHK